MKKELILLACMSTMPYLLNSAGRWADTTELKNRQSDVADPVLRSDNPMRSWMHIPGQYYKQQEALLATYVPDTGNHLPLSRALLERAQMKVKSSIKANWVLDTVASQYEGILVYMDKDNPELKAVIFTDNAGNMLMRLEQEGKYQEIRVEKIEFHTSINTNSQRPRFNRLGKRIVVLKGNDSEEEAHSFWKGAGYVPV